MSSQTEQNPPQAQSAADSVASVPVTFFTHSFSKVMPEQSYAVPITTMPSGLSALVNAVLGLEPMVAFDFLVNDEYVTTTLEKFMIRRQLNMEAMLNVEYTPAMQAQEGSKLPHDDWVSCVRAPVYAHSSVLLTGAYDHCVRLWDGDECLAIGASHVEAVKQLSINKQSICLPTKGSEPADSNVRKSAKQRRSARDIPSFDFASVGKDASMKLWRYDAVTNKFSVLCTVAQFAGSVDTVDVSHDGALVAVGGWDATVKLWRWDDLISHASNQATAAPVDAAPLATFSDHARSVLAARFSPSNGLLYTSGLDGCVKVWDCERLQLVSTLSGEHGALGMHIKPHAGGTDWIIQGHTDNRLRLYDSRTKQYVKSWSGHRQWVHSVTWLWRAEEPAETATLIASASADATVRVWDLRSTAAALLTFDRLHTDGVLDVTYVGENEIASGGADNKTKTARVEKPSK